MINPVLHFPEVPAVEVALIDRPGEAACVPVGAALGNAVFDACGVRLRQAPLTPARVKAGLASLKV